MLFPQTSRAPQNFWAAFNSVAWKDRASTPLGIAGEPAEAPRAIKEAHCRQPASGLTEYECGHERPADFGVLFHQSLEGDRDLMYGIGWRQLKQPGEAAIGDSKTCRGNVPKASAHVFRDPVTTTRHCSCLQMDGAGAPCGCHFAARLETKVFVACHWRGHHLSGDATRQLQAVTH
jgi:hypothetical protein